MAHFTDQRNYAVRCEWGEAALAHLAPADVVIIVDVLSFTTSVDIATARGATILPYAGNDDGTEAAALCNALLAGKRTQVGQGYSLSPRSLATIPGGTRLLAPSPNGSRLCALAYAQRSVTSRQVVAGSLRNAAAVAAWTVRQGSSVNLIPAGERWPDGTLRPALEDWIGVGAIVAGLSGRRSPEAEATMQAFHWASTRLEPLLAKVASGRELIERGFSEDVTLAEGLNCSEVVPLLGDDGFVDAASVHTGFVDSGRGGE